MTSPLETNPVDAPLILRFDDNRLVAALYGEHDQNLLRLEQHLGITLSSRGNQIAIAGPPDRTQVAERVLQALYRCLEQGRDVGDAEVDDAVRLIQESEEGLEGVSALHNDDLVLRTKKRHVSPRSPRQAHFIKAMQRNELVFGIGPAGTGKTYLAVASAVTAMLSGQVDRIILSRPAVEAGERLGFLPGDMKDKVDPYLRPLYDALHDMLPAEQVTKRLETGEIEIAPLAFMRGRTLSNAFIILDEAQNTTPVQMKMALTRLGENSRMAVTGDLTQVDLPRGTPSGLRNATDLLAGLQGVSFVQFTEGDVVRHPLVTRIVRAYDRQEREEREADLFERR